jgi:thiamine-phosphate pyrophosphorylase
MTARAVSSGRQAPAVVVITDPRHALARIEDVVAAAAGALEPGALVVQLRNKAATPQALATAAEALRSATARAGALFVVNAASAEALHVALDVRADGVHVPCRVETIGEARTLLGPGAWISTPAHTDDDVMLARRAGATAVLVSPIFDSPGKGPARGVEALSAARRLAGEVLVYALGGVEPSCAASCAVAGADGVAVIRALLEAHDPAAVARALEAPFRRPPATG